MTLSNPSMLLPLFIGVTALGVLLQAGVLLALYVGMRQAERRVLEKLDAIYEDAAPLLQTAHVLLEETGGKIRAIADNAHAISEKIREQVDNTGATVGEIASRTRQQAERVDAMVTEILDTVADTSRLLQDSIVSPLRQVGGWLGSVRSILDALRRPERKPRAHEEHTY